MSFPNTAPITSGEKGWGVLMGVVLFPIGLIATFGLLSNQAWARWVALVLAIISVLSAIAVMAWLLLVILPGANYPFGPWYVALVGLWGVVMALAAGRYWRGLRSTETE
jgi:hypothetical protein